MKQEYSLKNQEIKQDEGKAKLSLVHPQIVWDIAEVREYCTLPPTGKYPDKDSWKQVDISRYIDAFLRHTMRFMENPYGCDEETGIPHYKHAACNMHFICALMELDNNGSKA